MSDSHAEGTRTTAAADLHGHKPEARRSGFQIKMILTLAVVWVLLWGDITIANFVVGALIGAVVTAVFPLPPVAFHGRIHPIGQLRLIGRLLFDLVRASFVVAALAFRKNAAVTNAVVKLKLRTDSDLYLTMTSELVSLVPGSIVVEARRSTQTLYLHVMDVRGPEDIEKARQSVRDAEARVIRALGSRAEIRCLDSGEPMPEIEEGTL